MSHFNFGINLLDLVPRNRQKRAVDTTRRTHRGHGNFRTIAFGDTIKNMLDRVFCVFLDIFNTGRGFVVKRFVYEVV